MEKFIDKVVSELLNSGIDFENTIIILPGNRPKLFFRKSIQTRIKNQLLPEFLSIDEFILSISGLQQLSQIQLWFSAYQAYLKIESLPNDFERFLKWIPTLLKDFDDIQTSLANTEELFDYLVSAERIKNWGQEDLNLESNKLISEHLGFWEMAKKLFFQLNEDLLLKTKGYRGLVYKKAVENLSEFLTQTDKKFVFVGLNALTKAEKIILFELKKQGKADLFWDSDVYYMQDKNQEAGLFLRNYKKELRQENWHFEQDNFQKKKQITVTGIGKRVGQAKFLHSILDELNEVDWTETAIVLADESLLASVLTALPAKITKANITMGFPLNKSTMAYFFRSVFELQLNRVKLGNGKAFYFKNVVDILENSVFKEKTEIASELAIRIRKENRIFSSSSFFQNELKESMYKSLFELPSDTISFVGNLKIWIEKLMVDDGIQTNELDKEFLYRFSLLINQLLEEIKEFAHLQDFKTLYVLYNKLLQSETISFVGEPLNGLQIVGLLETRLLDFKNVIILSVNDGILPPGRMDNSFIPFDIRSERGLLTYTENDAVVAYHFYRLLQRTEKIELLYNTESDAMGSGEMSRFVTQIAIESRHDIHFQLASPEFKATEISPLVIYKTDSVLEKLHELTQNGISPSSLITYLRNPIEFYQQRILNTKEFEEAEETVGARIIGNIVHKSLDNLYQNLLGKILVPTDFENLLERVISVVDQYFVEEYKSGEFKKGKNLLVYRIVLAFVENVLKNDQILCANSELIIIELETEIETTLGLSDGSSVKLRGVIDRIDSLDGTKRIIDYKTGYVDDNSLKVKADNLEKIFVEYKFNKPLQLLLYAHLFFSKAEAENQMVQFGIYPLKFPKKGVIPLRIDGETDFSISLVKETTEPLLKLIQEILNTEIPFEEKDSSINSVKLN